MAQLAKDFPPGLPYEIIYDPTQFIAESVNAVIDTIWKAIMLVVLVVLLFLQTWRAAIIPIIAIPISLVGTFFVMAMVGFSINNLSLFGIVLAIGIVVDDAIVVVENVERNIAAGLSPHDAAVRSMDEVGAALVAIALVLCAVFIPSAFITGISGQFYRQFALTIAGATVISLIVSLTLSPALCALLLKPHDQEHRDRWWERPIRGAFPACSIAASPRRPTATAGLPAASVRIAGRHARWFTSVIIALAATFFRKRLGLHPAAGPRLPDRGRAASRRAHRWPAPTR